jgi:hypothetical protein
MKQDLEGVDLMGVSDVDGRIMLKEILRKQGVRMCNGFIWHRRDPVAGCEHGNEPSTQLLDQCQ